MKKFSIAAAIAVLALQLTAMTPAEAGTTVLTATKWTVSTLNVSNKDMLNSYLGTPIKVSLKDSDGICSVTVTAKTAKVARGENTMTSSLSLKSGSSENGTWVGNFWFNPYRIGKWKVTLVTATDCSGRSFRKPNPPSSQLNVTVGTKKVPSVSVSFDNTDSEGECYDDGYEDEWGYWVEDWVCDEAPYTGYLVVKGGGAGVAGAVVRVVICDENEDCSYGYLGKTKANGRLDFSFYSSSDFSDLVWSDPFDYSYGQTNTVWFEIQPTAKTSWGTSYSFDVDNTYGYDSYDCDPYYEDC